MATQSAHIVVANSALGSQLTDLLLCDDIEPGAEPSYQVCKTIYLYHPLGAKMVDAPIKAAQSQSREVSVPQSPGDHVVKQFLKEWARIGVDQYIANAAGVSRIYGVGSLVLGAVGKPSNVPLKPEDLWKEDLFFNVVDPLNTAGSIVLNQDPNSPLYQKPTVITVSGEAYHPSRSVVMMNERPVYIAFTTSAFGYTGRSVYQRALFPMKSFVQSMLTDDMVTQKAGLLIAKMKAAGSIVDRAMTSFTGLKRQMLQGAATGNVLSIGTEEDIETLNMQNVDGAGGWARGNILKNIATAADMPAVMLENETLTEGFGEGTEDAKIIARYIDGVREWLAPLYDFFDPIVMRKAWTPDFYATIQNLFPEEYGGVDFNTAFYQWVNSFEAVWPNLLKEPESEAVKVEETKHKALIETLEVLIPTLDPENKAVAVQWLADNMNENKLMFTAPLVLDYDKLAEYEPPVPGGLAGDEDTPKPPMPRADSDSPRLRALPGR